MFYLIYILIFIALIVVLIKLMEKKQASGGGTEKKKYYYHGSNNGSIKILEPRPSNLIKERKVVFATNNLSFALMFLGKWTDADISLGSINGKLYAMELYPDAFDKLRIPGYIYYLDPKYFHSDNRVGTRHHEFVSFEQVPVIKKKYFSDSFQEMKKLQKIKFIYFDQLEKFIAETI